MSAPARIALIGLPGTGKTTLAPQLAERLGWACADTDDEITASTGRTPAAILEDGGEPALRAAEAGILKQVLECDRPTVIACGGGLPTSATALRMLLDTATVVWLDAPDSELIGRIGDAAGRPLLAGDPPRRMAELRSARLGAYETANLRVSASGTPRQVTDCIVAALAGIVRVRVAERSYHVAVHPGAIAEIPLHLPARCARVAVIADREVKDVTHRVAASIRRDGRATTVIELGGGEPAKTWTSAGRLLQRLGAAGIQRSDCIIAVGGGSIGDVAGFAAATHLRGVQWICVPTTLLAMVDSAVGGKTGINLARGKNQAGAFWQPRAVLCDATVLDTLPDRAYRSAFAEIVKYSMVVEDGLVPILDRQLEQLLRRDAELLTDTVRRCCAVKADIVAIDEREAGPRAILNYGHTVGHALEAATGYGDTLTHGEAVAVGMRVAGRLSISRLGCPSGDISWQDEVLRRCGLGGGPALEPPAVIKLIGADKKRSGPRVGWVLLESRGVPRFGQVVPEPEVEATLTEVLAA